MEDKPTQRVDLTELVEVPAEDGSVTRKRLMDLTPTDLEALARQHRMQQAERLAAKGPEDAAAP
jgi:hypothetical protein